MNIKVRVVLSLFLIAALLISIGLLVDTRGYAFINVIALLAGILSFGLAISALAFAKWKSKTISEVMKEAISGLLNFGW